MINYFNKRTKFGKIVIISSLITILFIITFWVWLYFKLDAYQKTTSTYGLETVTNIVLDNSYDELSKLTTLNKNEFETKNNVVSSIKNYINDNTPNYIKNLKDSTEDLLIYDIKEDNNILGTVTLERKDGKVKWKPINVTYNNTVYNVNISVPEGSKVYINDILVSEKYLVDKVKYAALERVSEDISMPYLENYKIDNFYNIPTIIVKDENSNSVTMNKKENNETITYESKVNSLSVDNTFEHYDMIINDAKTYSKFTSEDASFTQIASRMEKGSVIYNNLRTMEVWWYLDHEKIDFSDITVSNLINYSETLFSVDVKYTYYVYRKGKEFEYPTNITITYYEDNGKWLIGDLQIISGENT